MKKENKTETKTKICNSRHLWQRKPVRSCYAYRTSVQTCYITFLRIVSRSSRPPRLVNKFGVKGHLSLCMAHYVAIFCRADFSGVGRMGNSLSPDLPPIVPMAANT